MIPSSYYVVAQIAVTLTGFIALIIAIEQRDKAFSRLAIWTILATTIGALLFSFVPELLTGLIEPYWVWRISCGTFGLFHLALIINHQARQLQFRKNTPIQWCIVLLSVFPVVFLKLAVGLGFFLDHAERIYLLGLLWFVFIALYLLSVIVLEDIE